MEHGIRFISPPVEAGEFSDGVLKQPALITILDDTDKGADNRHYIELFGALSAESYYEILEALKDTERVD